jgi:hypothetical protein
MSDNLQFTGVLIPLKARKAEIIPVEPDQDNACAGRWFYFVESSYVSAFFLLNNFLSEVRRETS